MKPRYAHDCPDCEFIGVLGQYDIYKCPQAGHPTIVARHGEDGEYISGRDFPLFDIGVRLALYNRDRES